MLRFHQFSVYRSWLFFDESELDKVDGLPAMVTEVVTLFMWRGILEHHALLARGFPVAVLVLFPVAV